MQRRTASVGSLLVLLGLSGVVGASRASVAPRATVQVGEESGAGTGTRVPPVSPATDALRDLPETPGTCDEVIVEAREASARDPLPERDANALYAHVHGAARDEACGRALARAAEELPCEGHALGAVVSGLVSQGAFPVSATRRLVARARTGEACMKEILPSVQHAINVDIALARDVRAVAAGKDENASQAGFLALGSLGLAARRSGATEVVAMVERTLSAELAKGDARRIVLLEAAGNAACEACTPALVRALGDVDPWTRRAAVASFRFRADRPSLLRTCAALERDAAASVREHAAWALAFEDAFGPERAACLARAAAADPDLDVRRTATRGLTRLAGENAGRDRALLALAKAPHPAEVRLVALEHLVASDPTPVTETYLP